MRKDIGGKDISEKDIKSNHNMNYNDMDNIRKINRFGVQYHEGQLESTTGKIFMTRPDLNILSGSGLTRQAGLLPVFLQAYNDYIDIIRTLTIDTNITSPFINMITNYAENFSTQDVVLETEKVGETFMGYSISYATHNIRSKNNGEISIKYTDNRYLEIYRLHKIWTEYISYVKRGNLSPKEKYIIDRIIDYQSSLYYFLLAEDGETIIYCSKYIGVFPKNTPDSAFSWDRGQVKSLDYNISYNYTFKDDYDYIRIFKEFNDITKASGRPVEIYNRETYDLGNTWVNNAYITADKYGYKLKYV